MIAEAERRYGGLDVLVNNAGMFFLKPIEQTSVEDFESIYRVNVEGTFLAKIKHAHVRDTNAAAAASSNCVLSLLGISRFRDRNRINSTKRGDADVVRRSCFKARCARSATTRFIQVCSGRRCSLPIRRRRRRAKALAADAPLGRNGDPREIAMAVVYLARTSRASSPDRR